MTHKSNQPPKTGLRAGSKKAGADTVSAAVPASLRPFATAQGASIFQVAATQATAGDLDKVREQIGPLDLKLLMNFYQKSQNPVWLWMAIGVAKQPQDIPAEVLDYLRSAAAQFWKAVVDEVCSAETVKFTPGKEMGEAISRGTPARPPLPDMLQILKLAYPGRNLVQAAAADIRDMSMAIGVQDHMRNSGAGREQSQTLMAEAIGRNSAETGPATASVKHMETRGRKLIRRKKR